MPKYNFGLGSQASEAELGDGFYTGPCPPPGVYDFEIKQCSVKNNSNGDPRIALVLEVVADEDDEKAEYNGAACFTGLNVTDQGAPWVNNFLDAVGADRKKFYSGDVTVGAKNAKGAQDILKIGSKKIVGLNVRALTKVRPYQGEDQMDIVRYLTDDDDSGKSKKRSADVEPDETATGLEDAGDVADTSDDGDDTYTKEELDELTLEDLKEILEAWEIDVPAKAKKPALVKLIMEAQASEDAGEEEDDADAESDEESGAESDAEAESGGDDLTEDELNEMSSDELKEYITEQGWELPRPPVKSKLVKAVLKYQSEPPF